MTNLQDWIGRQESASETLSAELVRKFNATLDLPDSGDVAPLLIHFCLAQPAAATATLGEDGHPARGGFLPPVELPRRMWAGGGFTFHDDIRVGQVVTRNSTIRDVKVKEGRTGTLCFVTVEHLIEADGKLAITERQDIVYRGVGGTAPPQPAAAHGAETRTVTPSAPLLFRYSALTFNGHRIHYDAPYTREVEGYPGLIVHGPMQATMLLHLAAELRGKPKRFEFRSTSPVFDIADFSLNAEADGDALRLWTASEGGPVAMEARAEW